MKPKLLQFLFGTMLVAGLAWATSARAAVTVYGVASSTGPMINVHVMADITDPAIVSFSFKLFYDPAALQVVNAIRNDAVWYMHDGTQPVPYMEPDASQPGEVLFVGGKLDARDPMSGVAGRGVLLGVVEFLRRDPHTPRFEMSIGREGNFASFVTVHGVILESLPGEVSMEDIIPTEEDQDLDGLTDSWEIDNFKDPELAFYSDDPDGDGINNQGEEALGSDPHDRDSNLHLIITRNPREILLEWTSFEGRMYTIEASEDLNKFFALETGIKATPPMNAYPLKVSEEAQTMFFRILLEPTMPR